MANKVLGYGVVGDKGKMGWHTVSSNLKSAQSWVDKGYKVGYIVAGKGKGIGRSGWVGMNNGKADWSTVTFNPKAAEQMDDATEFYVSETV